MNKKIFKRVDEPRSKIVKAQLIATYKLRGWTFERIDAGKMIFSKSN